MGQEMLAAFSVLSNPQTETCQRKLMPRLVQNDNREEVSGSVPYIVPKGGRHCPPRALLSQHIEGKECLHGLCVFG